MKRYIRHIGIIFLIFSVLPSCDVLNQAAEVGRLQQCTFQVEGVNNIFLAGIELRQGMKSTDLNSGQLMQLANAAFQKNMPLSFNVMVRVKNPNTKTAALSRMDYRVFLDGVEMLSGQMNQRYSIGPNSNTDVAVPVQLELYKALSGQSADAVSNIGFKLTGSSSKPVELLVKVKPYMQVGLTSLPYPGYIDIRKTL